jgi:hypothetical protein
MSKIFVLGLLFAFFSILIANHSPTVNNIIRKEKYIFPKNKTDNIFEKYKMKICPFHYQWWIHTKKQNCKHYTLPYIESGNKKKGGWRERISGITFSTGYNYIPDIQMFQLGNPNSKRTKGKVKRHLRKICRL